MSVEYQFKESNLNKMKEKIRCSTKNTDLNLIENKLHQMQCICPLSIFFRIISFTKLPIYALMICDCSDYQSALSTITILAIISSEVRIALCYVTLLELNFRR